jgi:protein TonB
MSLALSGRDGLVQAALPRGAGALVLVLAVLLHLAGGAAVYWAAQTEGTEAAGEGGLTMGLGPSVAAPGAVQAVEAEPVEMTTPEAARPVESDAPTEHVASPSAREAPREPVVDAAPPPAPSPEAAPQPAPADSANVADSVDPVVAPSVTAAEPDQATAPPDTVADTAPDRVPEAAAPDTVTATAPEQGLGVSRRPATRPQSVEEAGQRAAAEAATRAEAARQQRRAAEADRQSNAPAPQSAGRQGRGGSSQGETRGSGDGTQGGGTPGARADFAAIVAARLARAKQYPRSAQRARIEGTGTIWFRLNAAGQVTASRLTRGTGHAVLDQAIMDTLRRARLPAIPDAVGRARMEFSVPMSFTLR